MSGLIGLPGVVVRPDAVAFLRPLAPLRAAPDAAAEGRVRPEITRATRPAAKGVAADAPGWREGQRVDEAAIVAGRAGAAGSAVGMAASVRARRILRVEGAPWGNVLPAWPFRTLATGWPRLPRRRPR